MFGKKERTYKIGELWAVRNIMALRQHVEDMYFRHGKTIEDYNRAIEICGRTLTYIDEFYSRNKELDGMFCYERNLVDDYLKIFIAERKEMEKSAV